MSYWVYREVGSSTYGIAALPTMFWMHPANRSWKSPSFWFGYKRKDGTDVKPLRHASPGDYGQWCPTCKQSAFWDRLYGLCYHVNCTAAWNIPFAARTAQLRKLHPYPSPFNAKLRTVMAVASFVVQCIALYYFMHH